MRAVLCLSFRLVAPLLWATSSTGAADEGQDDDWSAAPPGTGRPYFSAEGIPGTALQDTLSVRNPTDRILNVQLSGGSWLRLAAPEVAVPARTRADVPFTVRIPDGTPPGARTATITARADGVLGPLPVWSGRPEFDAVDVRLTVTAAAGTVRAEAGTSVRFVPWGGVAGGAGALMAGGALMAVRRHGRRRSSGEQPCAREELAERLTEAMK